MKLVAPYSTGKDKVTELADSELVLSVIIPIYNVMPYLEDCLRSVFGAAEKCASCGWKVEIILVDDGSTDGCAMFLDEIPSHNDRSPLVQVRVVHQENSGVSVARNRGLDLARGKWIAFVDADDLVLEDWFYQMIMVAEQRPSVSVVCALDCLRDLGAVRNSCAATVKVEKHAGEMAREWAVGRYSREAWLFLNLFRRETVGNIRFTPRMRIKEDMVFLLTIVSRINEIVAVQCRGYVYRLREGSALHQFRRAEDSAQFFKAIEFLCKEDRSRILGRDLLQWISERDWSVDYDGATCPLRQLWRNAQIRGEINIAGVKWWWRPGVYWWMMAGNLSMLHITSRIRDWIAARMS